MKPSNLLKVVVVFVAATVLARPAPRAPRPAPPNRTPLAHHLARTEAHIKALHRHLVAAAQHKANLNNHSKLAERARKLVHHHARVPLGWLEYDGAVPSVYVTDNSVYKADVVEQEAETAAAALGTDIEALWTKHKRVQAERLVLWSKIAFRSVAEMELADQPLYRFELKSAGKTLDQQRLEAIKAVVQFARVVDHLANQAQDAVEKDPQAVFVQWHKKLADARKQMQDKMLLQSLVALDVYKPETDAGRMAASAKQLADTALAIVDSEKALAAAEAADDDEEADASRCEFQQAMADTAKAVAALDDSVSKAADAWGIDGVPGTKVAVGDLPDLTGKASGAGNSQGVQAASNEKSNFPPQGTFEITYSPGKKHTVVSISGISIRRRGDHGEFTTYTFQKEPDGSLSLSHSAGFETWRIGPDGQITIDRWGKTADRSKPAALRGLLEPANAVQ